MSQSYNPFYNIENPQLMGYEYAWSSFMRGQGLNNAIISQEIGQSWERPHSDEFQRKYIKHARGGTKHAGDIFKADRRQDDCRHFGGVG